MLTPAEIEHFLKKSRLEARRKALHADRDTLLKKIQKWDRKTGKDGASSAESILCIYEDMKLNEDVDNVRSMTVDAIHGRTGLLHTKISKVVTILEREKWIKVNRKTKPYVYEVIGD